MHINLQCFKYILFSWFTFLALKMSHFLLILRTKNFFLFVFEYRPGQSNWEYTMWKFHPDFSDCTWNQFWSFWYYINCYFDQLSSSEFWIFGDICHLQLCKYDICPKSIFKASKIIKMAIFDLLKPAQNWFHVNQSGSKITELPVKNPN